MKIYCDRKIILNLLMLLFFYQIPAMAEQKNLIYEYYEENAGQGVKRQYVEIKDLPSGEKLFKRKIENDYILNEEFILGANYDTRSWQVNCSAENTNYTGEKKENKLFIKGVFKGETVDKIIALDEKPFYYTPKFNLAKFAPSDLKQIKFWTLRKDKLEKYLMRAEKIGEDEISINGEKAEVVKIYYSAAGIFGKFYKRIYYFRKTDGLFVKKENPEDGTAAAELVNEN